MTPEEWVRQNFLAYLLRVQQYPSTLIALEKQIRVGELIKRFDILVYDSQHQPWMMVECKAPEVPLTESTLQQVLRYHISTPAKYLVITNGKATMGWEKKMGNWCCCQQYHHGLKCNRISQTGHCSGNDHHDRMQ
ncbi:MAG: type I restriction enzyme HsdR N-terminal domain-containing protein [Chitinophagaceae bacterium]|nr:type I restriction enzyme HsdR N-terminal domain-containing protein [Chitinophagaceae bacterium]